MTDAPKAGTRGTYHNFRRGSSEVDPAIVDRFTVLRVEGNLCWAKYDGYAEPSSFIWQFRDGPNKLHEWPGK